MKIEKKKIKDICKFVGGSQPPKSEFIYEPKDGYVRLIQIRDRLNDNFATYIPANSTKKLCSKTDILIGRYGPPVFQVFRGFEGAYNVAIMKAVPVNATDNDFLYYFLLQEQILRYVESMQLRTAGQTGVELDSLYEYPVRLPDIVSQRKIANVLLKLDAKIELNNKIISELESMAKTLYDYWFLQFDFPDENGKPYKSSGGKMVYNEELKREIPDGWEVGLLKDYAEILAGGDKPDDLSLNKTVDKCFEVISNGSENRGICGFTANSRIKVPAITISARGSVGYTFLRLEPFTPVIRLICMIPFDDSYLTFLAETMKHIKFSKNGSIQQQLTIPDLSDYRFVFPCHDVANKFNELVFDFELRKLKAIKENRDLASLRDFLLPMLMNGQVTFKDAAEAHND